MSTVLNIIGIVLLYWAFMARATRKDDYQSDLQEAYYEKKTALFWGLSTESEDEKIAEIKRDKGYLGRWERVKFNLWTWTLVIIGSIVLFGAYLSREPDESPWWPIIIGGVGLVAYWISSSLQKPIDKLGREVHWLKENLTAVKDRSERMRKQLELIEREKKKSKSGEGQSFGKF